MTNPSSNIANFNADNIFESVEDFTAVETEVEKKARLIKEHHQEAVKVHEKAGLKSKEDLMWLVYNRDTSQNLFRGGFDEWKKLNEKYVDIAICQVNEDLSYPEALEKVLGETEAEKILAKESKKQQRVESKDVYLEAAIMGVNPREYAKRINEEVDRQEQEIEISETQAILDEARKAGMNTTDPKIREKLLNDSLQRKIDTTELSEFQKAKKKIAEDEEDERLRNSCLVGEKILAGYKK